MLLDRIVALFFILFYIYDTLILENLLVYKFAIFETTDKVPWYVDLPVSIGVLFIMLVSVKMMAMRFFRLMNSVVECFKK